MLNVYIIMHCMEKFFDIFKQIMPNFNGNKITTGGLFMLFVVIVAISYLLLKFVFGCTFQNHALVVVWIITAFSLSLSLSCFYSAFVDWFKKQSIINAHKKRLFSVLDKLIDESKETFKECAQKDKDIFEINQEEETTLQILEDREIYPVKIIENNQFKYGIIKEQYFKWLKEYFKK